MHALHETLQIRSKTQFYLSTFIMEALQKTLQQLICIVNSFCIFAHYPDHGSSGIWFIQGIQVLAQSGNDAFIPDSSEYRWVTGVNSTCVTPPLLTSLCRESCTELQCLVFLCNKQHFHSTTEDIPRLFLLPSWVLRSHGALKSFAVSLVSKTTQMWNPRAKLPPSLFC